MFIFNPLDYILNLEFLVYIFGAFGFYELQKVRKFSPKNYKTH